jgi:hypothetical protein
MPKGKPPTLSDTVERFLAGLDLSGAGEVRAVLARETAAAFEQAPVYARARLVTQLRMVLGELENSELENSEPGEPNAPRLLRGVDAGYYEDLVELALRDLESFSTRELIRTARALEARFQHDPAGMIRFAQPLRSVAFDRRDGESNFPRIHLGAAVIQADGSVGERLAESPESFWRHVGEAILAYRQKVAAYWEAEGTTATLPGERRQPVNGSRVDALVSRRLR